MIGLYNQDSVLVGSQGTDGEGRFAIALLFPEPVRVRVTIGSADLWIGGREFREARVYQPHSGQEITGIDLEDCAILVRVAGLTDQITSEVYDEDGRYVRSSRAWTGESVLSGLEAGSYRLRLVNPSYPFGNYLDQWYDRGHSMESATPVAVMSGGTTTVAVQLDEGGRILGMVRGLPRDAAPFLYAYLTSAENPARLGIELRSDTTLAFGGLEDGAYKIAVRYRLSATAEDRTVWYPGTASWDSATAVSVQGHGTVRGVELIVAP